jgi:NADPH2:quinone reductase
LLTDDPFEKLVSARDPFFFRIGNMEERLHVTKVRGKVVFFGMAGGQFKLGNPLYLIGTSKTITGGDLWDYLTFYQMTKAFV